MKKQLYPVAGLTILLAIVAVAGYALPQKGEPVPIRVLLPNSAGPVVFSHLLHTDMGLDCEDCHHFSGPVEDGVPLCSECHNEDMASDDMPGRMDAFHQQCMQCHDPEPCTQCHFK